MSGAFGRAIEGERDRIKEIADGLHVAATSGVSVDDFNTSGLRVDLGECKLGGSWSAEGDSFHFTVTATPTFGFDPVTFTMPGHDPPVAWTVTDHPLARLGFPVIAAPAYRHPEPVVEGAATYMDPAPIILDAEPGRR